jgi:hypothetical protein
MLCGDDDNRDVDSGPMADRLGVFVVSELCLSQTAHAVVS